MEATITQSGALDLAQHRNASERKALFQHTRMAARRQATLRPTLRELVQRPLRQNDNGK